MRVAVAGAGSFAKFFAEEFPKAGHEVVIITRSHKAHFEGLPGIVDQRITDYSSVDELADQLQDCDAVVSTVLDYTPVVTQIHLNLVQACMKSSKCKRFIPSEFGANIETHPDLAHPLLHPVMDLLRSQSDVEWTVVAIGWLADYLVPRKNRYHVDIGPMHPLDHNTQKMTIPGDGNYVVGVVSARDAAKAFASILASETKWRRTIHIQGDRKTWLEMAELVKSHGIIPQLSVEHEELEPIIKISQSPEASHDEKFAAFLKLFAPSGAPDFNQDAVEKDRQDYFPKVHLRTVHEFLEDAKQSPEVVI